MGFPRQEYWSGLPFPLPGDLPEPGIKPTSLALQVRIKGAKYRFPLQDGTWDFPGDAVAGKGLIL